MHLPNWARAPHLFYLPDIDNGRQSRNSTNKSSPQRNLSNNSLFPRLIIPTSAIMIRPLSGVAIIPRRVNDNAALLFTPLNYQITTSAEARGDYQLWRFRANSPHFWSVNLRYSHYIVHQVESYYELYGSYQDLVSRHLFWGIQRCIGDVIFNRNNFLRRQFEH